MTVLAAKFAAPDASVDISSATTTNGTTVNRGTATDLRLVIGFANRASTALAGSYTVNLQGSNDGTTFTTVTADKGTMPSAATATGITVCHFAQLQYKLYRTQIVSQTTPVGTVYSIYDFEGLADSFDSTVQ